MLVLVLFCVNKKKLLKYAAFQVKFQTKNECGIFIIYNVGMFAIIAVMLYSDKDYEYEILFFIDLSMY